MKRIEMEYEYFSNNKNVESGIGSLSHSINHVRKMFHTSETVNIVAPLWLGLYSGYFLIHQELRTVTAKINIIARHMHYSEKWLATMATISARFSGPSSTFKDMDLHQVTKQLRDELYVLSSSTQDLKSSLIDYKGNDLDGVFWSVSPLSEMWMNYHKEALLYLDAVSSVTTAAHNLAVSADVALELQADLSTLEPGTSIVDQMDIVLMNLSKTIDELIVLDDTLVEIRKPGITRLSIQPELDLLKDANNALKVSISHALNLVTIARSTFAQESVVESPTYNSNVLWTSLNENLAVSSSVLLTELDELGRRYFELHKHTEVMGYYGLDSTYANGIKVIEEIIDGLNYFYRLSSDIPKIMGSSEEKSYLLLAHSSDELRPTGGFISGVWLMKVKEFKVVGLEYYDVIQLDDGPHIQYYPEPPYLLRQYMGAANWFIRDVSWLSDFELVARTAQDMFRISTGIVVDGVIGVNQWALVDIVQGIGEVKLEGREEDIRYMDLITKLESGTDDAGREYSDLILRSVLKDIVSQESLMGLWNMAQVLKKTLATKDIQIYLVDSNQQQLIQDFGWDGGMKSQARDFIYVVDSNVGWSKSDRNIEREINYFVDLSDLSKADSKLELVYKNHSGYSAAKCEPQWVDRGDIYSELKNACHWNLMRIYIPKGAVVKSHTLLPLPRQSIRAERMGSEPYADTFELRNYNGSLWEMSGLIVTDVSAEDRFNVSYKTPLNLAVNEQGCYEYSLTVKKQPGVRYKKLKINISLPENVIVIDSIGVIKLDDSHLFLDSNLDSDKYIRVSYASNNTARCVE
tara:strand:+ start:5652 stop:8063 length:2412 start_codon:yes stop_codon:yes gene_type:complete